MATLNLSEKLKIGLEKMAQLSAKQRESLLEILDSQQPTLFYEQLAGRVVDLLPEVDAEDVADIVFSALQLISGRVSAGVSGEKLSQDILETTELPLQEEESPEFHNFLVRLLTSRNLGITAKAISVIVDQNATFHNARILTDVRPIFGEDIESDDEPSAAFILHTLKVEFHEGEELKEFFVAMDKEELAELAEVIERALLKEERLQQKIERSGMRILTLGGD